MTSTHVEQNGSTGAAVDEEALPFSLPIEVTVTDPDVIRELWAKAEGRQRDEFVLTALRLGTIALRQARGEIDADSIRREGERLMAQVGEALNSHRMRVESTLSQTLSDYFDPESGRFTERVDRLLKQDGDLEQLLARQITAEDSAMSRRLETRVGEQSPLFRLLSPQESTGLLKALVDSLQTELEQQRKRVLHEFSLDNEQGALSRVVVQLGESNGKLTTGVQTKIDEMLKQFSFDSEESAISRMRKTVDTTSQTITKHLTLDQEDSALSRLRRELMNLLKTHGESSQKFQEEVRATLESMQARRKEAARSTRHGDDFEVECCRFVSNEAQQQGDVADGVGNTTGSIRNCKVGDVVIELGPDNAAAGARIVLEAKEKAGYTLTKAREEIEQARKNREAAIGMFVFSKMTAPADLEPLARYGNDLIVVWDADDPASDVYLKLGLSVAKALCARQAAEKADLSIDLTELDKALLDVEKQVDKLDEIRPWAETIKSNSDKILERLRISRDKLSRQAALLKERVDDLRQHLSANS